MKNCRILLNPLSNKELSSGYSQKGLVYLTNDKHFIPQLPFSRQDFFIAKPNKQQGMSISGYQPKLQLIIEHHQFNSIDEKGDYILKPSPEDYPYLAENEHATMQVMRNLGFKVPENGLIPFLSEEPQQEFAYVVKRFDRSAEGKPIHQEQLDGAMGIAEKYGKIESDSEQYISYERVAEFILNHTENNFSQRQEIFRRIIYAYLLGNNDLHLRNFSLIYSKEGTKTLAPIYDFVSVAPYSAVFNSTILALPLLKKEEGGEALAHGFHTQYGEYIGQDFIEFGENIGLNRKVIEHKLFPQIEKEQQIVEATYQRSFMPQSQQTQVLDNYRQRLARLKIINEPIL